MNNRKSIIDLTINDDIDDNENGAMKKTTIRNNAIPINIHENLVCSQYSIIYRFGSSRIEFDIFIFVYYNYTTKF